MGINQAVKEILKDKEKKVGKREISKLIDEASKKVIWRKTRKNMEALKKPKKESFINKLFRWFK